MGTYVTTVLGCLTAMWIVSYYKTLRGRVRRREPVFRRSTWDEYNKW